MLTKQTLLILLSLILTTALLAQKDDAASVKINSKYDAKKQLHGPYEQYFGEKLQIKGNHEHGIPNGHWNFYYSENHSLEGDYVKGKKEGNWILKREDNALTELHYENGQLEGLQQSFYRSGAIRAQIHYLNNELHGSYMVFNPSGDTLKIVDYEHGKKSNRFIVYDKFGDIVHQLIYRNGFPYDLIKSTPQKFNLVASYEGTLKAGNGNIVVNRYMIDHFFMDTEMNLKNGLPDGPVTFKSINNQIHAHGYFTRGFMTGTWKTYKISGIEEVKFSLKDSVRFDARFFKTEHDLLESKFHFDTELISFKKTGPSNKKQLTSKLNELECTRTPGWKGFVLVDYLINENGQYSSILNINCLPEKTYSNIRQNDACEKIIKENCQLVFEQSPLFDIFLKDGFPVPNKLTTRFQITNQ